MSLNIALTGIDASNTMMTVVSDNIANANTTGFKRSRAEFGDLVDSMSKDGSGLGVRLQRTTQTFKQGSIASTDNTFDMAITGDGFFQVKSGTSTLYTRAGSFRTNTQGFVVDNSLQNVQGYQVQVSDPQMTTEIVMGLTLDGSGLINNQVPDPDPSTGTSLGTGAAGDPYTFANVKLSGNAAVGDTYATNGLTFTKTAAPGWDVIIGASTLNLVFDPTTGALTSPVALDDDGAGVYWNLAGVTQKQPTPFSPDDPLAYNHATSVDIVDSMGLSHTVKSFFLLTAQGFVPPAAPSGTNTWQVYHQVDGGGAIIDGGTVSFDNATGAISAGPTVPTLSLSTPALGTGADPMTINLNTTSFQQGTAFAITDLSANGSLRSREIIPTIGDLQIDSSTMQPKITRMVDLGINLNALEMAPTPTILLEHTVNLDGSWPAPATASFNPNDPDSYSHSNLTQVYDSLGINHSLQTYFVTNGTSANIWHVFYTLDGGNQTDGGTIGFDDPSGAPNNLTLVETPITFTAAQLGSGATALSIVPDFSKVLQIPGNGTDNLSSTQSVLATNASADTDTIDATNPSNYQYASALTIYDSLGIDHTLNLYFRKTADNTWNVYRQFTEIESAAQKVGTLTFDSIGMPVRAMDSSGYIDPSNLLSLKMPGITFANGAGRQNIELDFANTTQFDSQSIINSLNQDGYTMGNLSGVEVDASGNIVASYSNDQSQIMGQVALARFANTQGLKRIGDNNWVATTESGIAVTGEPGVGLMGKLVTSALEGSNVELTKELVDMLVAQRSFQANSQVINTSGTLYQSILNIRS